MSRILIAEGDQLIGSFLSSALRASGFETLLVREAAGAEEHALTGEFDLLILDAGLPGQGGLGVLRDLRSRGSTVPVLVLTGHEERQVVATVDAGAEDVMTKPLRFDELLARVRRRLRSGGARGG